MAQNLWTARVSHFSDDVESYRLKSQKNIKKKGTTSRSDKDDDANSYKSKKSGKADLETPE